MATMFELTQVSKSFGATRAVAPTDLDIPKGRTTVLIGPSGCGKSTLLRLMNGLIAPDTGHVTFDGSRVSADDALMLRRRMGYVIQAGGLFPHLTADRNITVMAQHLGWAEDRIQSRLGDLTDLTRFPADALKRYPAELSGGQRQRIALARAILKDAPILVLDEATSALDSEVEALIQNALNRVMEGKTVLAIAHRLSTIARMDRIIVMDQGKIVEQGTHQALLDQNGLYARYWNRQSGGFIGVEQAAE